ncbi:S-adenosyl-L-methionine-dependent methyltransferase [Ophiobolus disseminans]|uniref:S-adenosyl-L-methionine-dependent methyltransferase n=1 Tax=Ophiobolus disseminans TaxID=1469910 RepID=A0A6A7ACK8_9PLEO|nr:S-adenosyl-L-methionine-dependent methyltransferase [Ophiobolus disseminans]
MSDSVPENLKARVKESYDAIADTYASQFTKADDPIRLGYLRRLFQHLESNANNEAGILELGCGAGIPATKFMLQNEKPLIHVIGNDLSTSQLDLARKNLAGYEDRLTLLDGDMLSLSFPDSTFDAVSGFYSIIHLPREEQTQLMRKIVKWLKPGGLFLGNFSATEMSGFAADHWLDQEKGWMYWSGWGEEASLKMVEEVGLEVLTKDLHQDEGDAKFLWVLAKKAI